MKALTVWQPWATLIAAGAKPYEYRGWPAHDSVQRQRIVIHAGARPVRRAEVQDILLRLRTEPEITGLDPTIALPILERALTQPGDLPLASGLATAVLGTPRLAADIHADLTGVEIDEDVWGWPLTDIRPMQPIVPARGAQGFWTWPHPIGDAA